MVKKFCSLVLFFLTMFVLSGCGADVHTNTVFHEDGSGERVIAAKIYYEDEAYIDGGFDNLDVLIRQNAPLCLDVNKIEGESEEYFTYEFAYEFSNIDDYMDKTEEITGEKPDIVWKEKTGAFQKKITYKETITTQQLISWVTKAMKDTNLAMGLEKQWYHLETNTVYYEDECVWSGTSNPEFQIDATPKVENVSVYTKYLADGGMFKKLYLSFRYEDYMNMDVDQALSYLQKNYSEKFEIDTSCNGFVLEMRNEEEMNAFFQNASEPLTKEECQKAGKEWNGVAGKNCMFEDNRSSSVISDVFEVKEAFNMRTFLDEFKLSKNRIYYYIKVPSSYQYETSDLTKKYELKDRKKYSYATALTKDQMFCMNFQFHNTVKVLKHQVSYELTAQNTAIQTVSITVEPKGKKITREDLIDYFSAFDTECFVKEKEEEYQITLVKEIPLNTECMDANWVFSWKQDNDRRNGMKTYFLFLQYDPDYYLPIDGEKVRYEVRIPDSLNMRSMSWNGKNYEKTEIRSLKQVGYYRISGTLEKEEKLQINMMLVKLNSAFLLILVLLLALIVLMTAAVLIYIYMIKHGIIKVNDGRE
ncbi:MAG: hypothetical protein PUB10_09465 [Clostridiales bacterium]|nr:hypothetical protein [Clostridiales bacterium]